KRRQGDVGNARRKANLSGRGSKVEETVWAGKRVVRFGIVHDLCVVNAKSSPQHCLRRIRDLVHETGTRSEVFAGIGEGLLLVAEAQVECQIGKQPKVVLRKQRPESVIDGVSRFTVALGVTVDVGNVIEIGRAFTRCNAERARFVGKRSEKARAPEFLPVSP